MSTVQYQVFFPLASLMLVLMMYQKFISVPTSAQPYISDLNRTAPISCVNIGRSLAVFIHLWLASSEMCFRPAARIITLSTFLFAVML